MQHVCYYSVNPWIKFHIQKTYRNDIHYVWMSAVFDSVKAPHLSAERRIPESSNPAGIAEHLSRFQQRFDQHDARIAELRARIIERASMWLRKNEISDAAAAEITALAMDTDHSVWRPLLYIIPKSPIENRVRSVEPTDRASIGPEYIIEDLKRSEFDIIELRTRQ